MASNAIANETLLFEPRQIEEAQAVAAFTPGDLVTLVSTGKVQRHATAAGLTQRFFGMNNDASAKDKDGDYVADEVARYVMALPGDVIDAFLADTIAVVANVTYLVSNGDGSLKAAAAEVGQQLVGVAIETKTASGKTRCLVRVL